MDQDNPTFQKLNLCSVFTLAILLVVLTTACKKPNASFRLGGELSLLEKQSLVRLHPSFAGWTPTQSVLWVRDGVTRHVCVKSGDIGSISLLFEVIVFDADGKVVEANIIDGPNTSAQDAAKYVTSVSPVRVVFAHPNGGLVERSGIFSSSTWRQDMQKQQSLYKALRTNF